MNHAHNLYAGSISGSGNYMYKSGTSGVADWNFASSVGEVLSNYRNGDTTRGKSKGVKYIIKVL